MKHLSQMIALSLMILIAQSVTAQYIPFVEGNDPNSAIALVHSESSSGIHYKFTFLESPSTR